MTTPPPPGIFEALTSVSKRLSHLEKEPIMPRSVAVLLALLILPSFAPAQELATGQQGTHEVVKGETLWALADQYLGDPFRWPLIFEANRDRIEDPHWIYPHQLLVIPGLEAEPAQLLDVAVVTPGQEAEPMPMPVAVAEDLPACPTPSGRTIFYEGGDAERGCVVETPALEDRTAFYEDLSTGAASISGTDRYQFHAVPRGLVYSAPWLEGWNQELAFIGTVARLAEVDVDRAHRSGAVVYEKVQIELEEGVQLQVGDLLQAFVVGRGAEELGQVVRPTGILAVTSVEDAGVVAMVSTEFARVRIGQRVRMVPAFTLEKGVEAQEVESNLTAAILGFDMDRVFQGFGAVAFLDVGEEEGVTIGDEFIAYVNRGDGWEGELAARLQVVLVNGATASARIITVNEPILETGTRLYLVRKMN